MNTESIDVQYSQGKLTHQQSRNFRPLPRSHTTSYYYICFTVAMALWVRDVNISFSPDEWKTVREDQNVEAQCFSRCDGSKLGAHVATITLRGASISEPLQKPACQGGKQTGVIGGKKQLTEVFPRQEVQLPTQPPSQHVSSVCSLSLHGLQPLPLARSETHNTTAKGLQRTLSQSPSHDLRSSPIWDG